MSTRARVRALVAERWPVLLGGVAVAGYAILVVGFGLDFRPLHHDEVVTLHVAGQPSARDVLHVAVQDRHGPPLHYLVVHASLDWRHDILGLRLPSALFGILAVGLAYGCGRELMGRAGGATVALVTAIIADHDPPRPVRARLHRDDRARLREPVAHARARPHGPGPVGRAVRAGGAAARRVPPVRPLRARVGARAARRPGRLRPGDPACAAASGARVAVAAGLALGAGALLWLRHLYSPLQSKYGVGKGGAVVDLTSQSFWSDLGLHVTGSSVAAFWILVGLAVVLGIVSLAFRDRRAAIVAAVWLLLPLLLLRVLTASSEDFAPERHLSFLLPGYAIALAGFALELGRLPGRRRVVGAVVLAALLTPVCGRPQRPLELQRRPARREPRARGDFGPRDVLLTTAGVHGPLRTRGCSAPTRCWTRPTRRRSRPGRRSTPPAGCGLIRRLGQRAYPQRAWLIASTERPARRRSGAHRRRSDDVDLRRRRGRGVHAAYTRSERPVPGTASGARSSSAIRRPRLPPDGAPLSLRRAPRLAQLCRRVR